MGPDQVSDRQHPGLPWEQARAVALAWIENRRPYGEKTMPADLWFLCTLCVDDALSPGSVLAPHDTARNHVERARQGEERRAKREAYLAALIELVLVTYGPAPLEAIYALNGLAGLQAVVMAAWNEVCAKPAPEPIDWKHISRTDWHHVDYQVALDTRANESFARGYLDPLTFAERLAAIAASERNPLR